ncbi:MAG: adenosylhomocysteinase, partial [Leucobacter sp.]
NGRVNENLPWVSAERLIAHFNRSTNRLIAGTRIGVVGGGENHAPSETLVHMLRTMGARVTELQPGSAVPPVLEAVFATDPRSVGKIGKATLLVTNAEESGLAPIGPELGADDSLAKRGAARIEWAHRHMSVTRELAEEFAVSGSLRGVRIGVVLVLEPKTAVLVLELARAGADVRVFAPANEVDAETAAALRARGIVVLGSEDADAEQDAEQARDFMRWQPQLLIDDGAHMIRLAHEMPEVRAALRGAAEETTSGVRPIRHMHADGELSVPVVPVNDAAVKLLFDNLHGTGQTCVFAITDELAKIREAADLQNVPITAQSTWLVLGYGPVGVGVCRHARALGAHVIVAELDAVRALAAETDGYEVTRAADAAGRADVIVSASGIPGTIEASLARLARPRTVFAVAGGTDGELDFGDATWTEMAEISPHVASVNVAQAGALAHEVLVLAHGYGVNYTAGGGNPIEIMDLSFAAQLAALRQLVDMGVLGDGELEPGIFPLEAAAEQRIARLALAARGSGADIASDAQIGAARAWRTTRYAAEAHPTAGVDGGGATPTPTVVVYSARLVIPVTGPRITDGAVAVRGDKIVHVGDRRWVLESLEDAGIDYTEEHWQGVITPGLVNAHTHLQYTDMNAVAQRRYEGFDDWAESFDTVYDKGGHDWAAASKRGAELAFASGTTACADVVSDETAVSALHDAGMHGIAYWEVMGWSNAEWHSTGRDATVAQLDGMPATPGVGVSPHAPYSLEVQPLLDVPDIVRARGMRLHIHLAEAHMEHEHHSGHEAWPELGAESFRALRSRGVGVSSTQFVDHLGVLGPDCHIAHGVYMTDRDRSLLRARGTSVALCPRSNDVIGLDLPPVAAYLREGNQICVGTDSLSSSPSLDPLADLALLYRIAREQGYAEPDLHQRLFGAMTLGGATALGLGVGAHRVGQLAVGALADLAFFDLDASVPDDALAELVEAGAGTCRRTIVAGVTKFIAADTRA